MEATILGTSCMVPTKDRNVSGLYLEYKTEGMLFDCGEGTQRQMNIAGINRNKVGRIFISHWHGDHVSGIIGLLQTVGNQTDAGEQKKICIYGPKESKKRVEHMVNSVIYDMRIDLEVHELSPKGVELACETADFAVYTAPMNHSIPCVGYLFVEKDRYRINMAALKKMGVPEGPHLQNLVRGESSAYKGKKIPVKDATTHMKGRRFAIIPDTAMTPMIIKLAKEADVMIIESTYCGAHEDKARKHHHLTAAEAATLAADADVKKLYLTHFSQRYDDVSVIEDEARLHFPDAKCAHDFMKIKF